MKEYHCEFCNATGTKLRNEEKGCCNNCGAPIGITKEQAQQVMDVYYTNLPFMSTATVTYPQEVEITIRSDSARKFTNA